MTDKPWSKEPTPISDDADLYDYHTAVEVCKDLEQQLRYARTLMSDPRRRGNIEERVAWLEDWEAYLKATEGEG